MTSIDWLIKKIESFGIDTKFISESINEAKEMHYKELMGSMQRGMELQEKENNRIGFRERNGLLPQQEISDEEIKKSMFRYNITDFGQMAAYITGAQWYKEQLKQSNCQEILDSSKKRAANYMNLKRK
jgi:hypothetical protein